MKKLEIIIRPESLEDVKEILSNHGCTGMTVFSAMGCGIQKGDRSNEYKDNYTSLNLLPKIQVNAVIVADALEGVLKAIREKVSKCRVGDGKVFVYDVCDAMRIRTGERGIYAVASPKINNQQTIQP